MDNTASIWSVKFWFVNFFIIKSIFDFQSKNLLIHSQVVHVSAELVFLQKKLIPEDPAFSTSDINQFDIFSGTYVRGTICNHVPNFECEFLSKISYVMQIFLINFIF